MRRDTVATCFFLLLLFLIGVRGQAVASIIERSKLTGTYYTENNHFDGQVSFLITEPASKLIQFHIPGNFYSQPDSRDRYQLLNGQTNSIEVERKDLGKLKNYFFTNQYHALRTEILEVTLEKESLPFKVVDNPLLPPRRSIEKTNLIVDFSSHASQKNLWVTIHFKTFFQELPKSWNRILRDFSPRPVFRSYGKIDFMDRSRFSFHSFIDIEITGHKKGAVQRKIKKETYAPFVTLLIDPWSLQTSDFYFATFKKDHENVQYFSNRIQRVLQFLKKRIQSLKDTNPFRLIIWDGPLESSGKTVLLPRKLLQYDKHFFKLFEIEILKGLTASVVQQNYLIDSRRNPWILPAIYGEVIRAYFDEKYEGDSRWFPWDDWINPDYYQQSTIKNWLVLGHSFHILNASDPTDLLYSSGTFHPAFEKGFHLLPLLTEGSLRAQRNIEEKLIQFLQANQKKQIFLSDDDFFNYFADSSISKERGINWLKAETKVDFVLKNVSVLPIGNQFQIEIEFENLGNLFPPVEIALISDNGEKEIEWIQGKKETQSFLLDYSPEHIEINPFKKILEEDYRNNHWDVPVKFRPIWDIDPADRWLFTAYPVIDGNFVNGNLGGLSMTINYLEKTGITINGWQSGNDEEILWTGTLFHRGFPTLGSMLYLKSDTLNASREKTLGIEIKAIETDPNLSLDFNIFDEKLNPINGNPILADEQYWQGAELTTIFPLLEGDYFLWNGLINTRTGQAQEETTLKYTRTQTQSKYTYYFDSSKTYLALDDSRSWGAVPLQHYFPMGGAEGLPGFPRNSELLVEQRNIFEIGITFPSVLEHSSLNLIEITWLDRVEISMNYHWGEGWINEEKLEGPFQDIEINFEVFGEFFMIYQQSFEMAVAQPIGHDTYKDTRLILLSKLVF